MVQVVYTVRSAYLEAIVKKFIFRSIFMAFNEVKSNENIIFIVVIVKLSEIRES